MSLADVLVFRGVGQTYSYDLGADNQHDVSIGDHVDVRFGRSLATGLVIGTKEKDTSNTINFKPIESKNEKLPFLSNEYIKMIDWFSHFYHSTPFKAYQTIIGKKKDPKSKFKKAKLFNYSVAFYTIRRTTKCI